MFERTQYGGTCFVSVSVSFDESTMMPFDPSKTVMDTIGIRLVVGFNISCDAPPDYSFHTVNVMSGNFFSIIVM